MPERDAFGLPADPEGSRALTARPVSDSERFEMSIEQDSESHPHSLGEAHSEHVMTAPGLNAVDPMSAAALPTFGVSALRTPASGVPLVGSERSGHQLTGDYDALQILLQASAAAESLQQRFSELQQRRSELIAEQQQLETDRRTFEQRAHQFAAQVAADRSAQRELHAELEHRSARIAQQEETLERQLTELRAAQRTLNEERVLQKQAIRAELEEERQKIQTLRQELEAEREQLAQRRENDRVEHTLRLEEADGQLRTEKQRLTERLREEFASELSQLNREKQEWRQFRDQQKAELQQQAEDLQQQREVFGEQLETEQLRIREELEKRRQMLLTEQSNLQRRYRFQFEHLGRAKEDLELEVRELRREQQMFRAERLRFLEQHRLRFHQLEKIRSYLDGKETSLSRESRIVERSRAAAMSDIRRQQQRSEEEREAIAREMENRQKKLRQQETAMAELAARLEDKSQRLARLRSELDHTQGEILEHRLTIEESRIALVREGSVGESNQARLEQAQNDVHSWFDRLRSQLNAERDRLESAAAEISERQAQFRNDRAELEQWFTERESALQARFSSAVVDELRAIAEAQKQQIAELQERSLADRREAERGLRELQDQLAAYEMRAFRDSGTGSPSGTNPPPRTPESNSDPSSERATREQRDAA